MKKPKIGAWGVFLYDTGQPATLWQYEGQAHAGQHVFTRGSVSSDTFMLIEKTTLDDFWPLTIGD